MNTRITATTARRAAKAPLLGFVIAPIKNPQTGAGVRTVAFGTGAAWQSLALQAHQLGLSTRAMGGIHHDRVYQALGVPAEDFESMIGIAIGDPGERDALPTGLRDKEQPYARKSVREFAFEGRYTAP